MNRDLTSAHVPAYSLFAQLLASEHLRVTVDRAAKTASFSPEARILTLPSYSNFDNDAWLLFIAHEVGHALFTPADSFTCPAFTALAAKYGHNAVASVVNVFEDVRIERLVREKYRGLAGTFSRGYHSLMTRKFFGFSSQSIGSLWSQKSPLDRVNIYAKVGGLLRLSLSESQEVAWYNRALRAQTYDEILSLVADVMAELTEEQRKQAAHRGQQHQPSQGQTTGKPSQSQPSQGAIDPSAKDAQSQDAQSGTEQGDASEAPSSGSSQDAQPSPSQGAPAEPTAAEVAAASDPFAIASQEAAEKSLRDATAFSYNESGITVLPTSTGYLHHNDRTVEQVLALWKATPEQRDMFRTIAHQQRREQSSILASMIAAFRANQAAWQSRRVQVSRSGVIDTAKLAQYKLTEDLFLRRRSLPEAQNHGFVLHVDWSSSMEGKMSVVLWQVLHLIWFAESIKVPVSVYGFSNMGSNTAAGDAYAEACRKAYRPPERARLIELYRSDAPASVKQDAQSFLLALVLRFAGVPALSRWNATDVDAMLADPKQVAYHVPGMPKSVSPIVKAVLPTVRAWGYEGQPDAFHHREVMLGGTPLYKALFASIDTVRKFRQSHRIEQCVSVWLTDGEDSCGLPVAGDATEHVKPANPNDYYRANDRHFTRTDTGTLFDPRTSRTFKVEQGRALATLFSLHRALTGATVICIDITSAPLNSFSRVLPKSVLAVLANNVGEQDVPSAPHGRRRRHRVRPKQIKQTRKRVVIKSDAGTFVETGLMLVTRAQYPEIGCDAYLVTHPDWWTARDNSSSGKAQSAVSARILSDVVDDEEEEELTPEEREAEAHRRPVRLAAALIEGAAHIAMRRLADLLVPYMAVGRDDATV